MTSRRITLAELIDNMEKNGYEQGFGHLIHYKEDKTVEDACALGQGMLNLGFKQISGITHNPEFKQFVARVAYLNDRKKKTPDEIAKIVREEFKDNLNMPLAGYTYSNSFWGSLR